MKKMWACLNRVFEGWLYRDERKKIFTLAVEMIMLKGG